MFRSVLAGLLVSQLFIAVGCSNESTAPTQNVVEPQSVATGATNELNGQVGPNQIAAGLPDLRVENITHRATIASDGKYSVVFYLTVANRGTATSGSFVVGGKGWGTGTISTCTGLWRATNTTTGLAPSATRVLILYGPGYVGPRVARGTYLTVTGIADAYCAVRESYESNNALTRGLRIGY